MEFTFTIVHIDGIKNILPDSLSRLYPIPIRSSTLSSSTKSVSMFGLRLLPDSPDLLVPPPEEQRPELLINAHAFAHDGAAAMIQRVK